MSELPQVGCCCRSPQPASSGSRCCGAKPPEISNPPDRPSWITGVVTTPVGDVPVAGTVLRASDRIGAWKVRWGIGRMQYRVEPGLYAVGRPDPQSPVLVSANYK